MASGNPFLPASAGGVVLVPSSIAGSSGGTVTGSISFSPGSPDRYVLLTRLSGIGAGSVSLTSITSGGRTIMSGGTLVGDETTSTPAGGFLVGSGAHSSQTAAQLLPPILGGKGETVTVTISATAVVRRSFIILEEDA